MCGIIGIVSDTDITEKIWESLKWLSYRGYDSVGFAVKSGKKIYWEKHVGKIEDIEFKKNITGHIGIGHTRWATHGPVNEANTHPHVDCKREIAIVHNGIINNYTELKDGLIEKGHIFFSQTDSEVVAHLIEEHLKWYKNGSNSFLYAFRDAVVELKGANAIAAIYAGQDNLYAYQNSSHIVIGNNKEIKFISSDIPAFLKYTNKYLPLEDDQICVISKNGFRIYNLDLKEVPIKQFNKCPFDFESVIKGDDEKHFMSKEIKEQPRTLKRSLDNLSINTLLKIRNYIHMKKIKKIYLTGSGSSLCACIAGKYILEKLVKIPSEAISSSELKYLAPNIVDHNSLIIALSQSGETYDTCSVIDSIFSQDERPYFIIITNIPHSTIERSLHRNVDKRILNADVIRMEAGFEICVASTKTYTIQLYLLSLLGLVISTGKLTEECYKIPDKVEEILRDENIDKNLEIIVSKIKDKKGIFTIGKEINLSTALEAALKLKEICYLYAEGLPGGELKHGPLAVIDENTPTIVIFPSQDEEQIWQSTFNNLMEIKARKGLTISVCFEGDEMAMRESDYVIKLPNTEWHFVPILQVVPLQLLAYKLSIAKGINPDRPKNLAKTLTVD